MQRLLAAQFPQWCELPLVPLGSTGSSNRLYRLGEEWLVRLPRQPGGGAAIRKEQRWLPYFSERLPVAVPEMVGLGEPATGYGEHWAVMRWLPGELAELPGSGAAVNRAALADDLAAVVLALRAADLPRPDARDDPALRWYRGAPLAAFDRSFRRQLAHCRALPDCALDFDAAERLWEQTLELPEAAVAAPDRWYHSDLVRENLLFQGGRLVAVLDFGGLGIGDPTIDLHGAWEVLDGPGRARFRERLGVSDAHWRCGRGWALAIALGALSYYWHSLPARRDDRLAMARAVLADGVD